MQPEAISLSIWTACIHLIGPKRIRRRKLGIAGEATFKKEQETDGLQCLLMICNAGVAMSGRVSERQHRSA